MRHSGEQSCAIADEPLISQCVENRYLLSTLDAMAATIEQLRVDNPDKLITVATLDGWFMCVCDENLVGFALQVLHELPIVFWISNDDKLT